MGGSKVDADDGFRAAGELAGQEALSAACVQGAVAGGGDGPEDEVVVVDVVVPASVHRSSSSVYAYSAKTPDGHFWLKYVKMVCPGHLDGGRAGLRRTRAHFGDPNPVWFGYSSAH